MHVFDGPDSIAPAIGTHLGHGEWVEITQDRVSAFADATDDHQWIHVDAERAAKGPFGGTVAHGYLTLSLLPMLGKDVYRFENFLMGVNYGLNKVRFPQPVRVGAKVRMSSELVGATPGAQGVQVVLRNTIEIQGSDKPACVAEAVVLLVPNPGGAA